ncbi:MAG: 3-methyl-2-oxobutanoate hydroxymethyltransferase [Akkermansia sp.]|nr:3-methyl-2-oxobutanoate hydroxymethyltransferase [Akkermansia sp.]MBQ7024753.1 3-methyl-2-oxobutanoate hydroxymethyltransferase [Akkermansia sp.]
MNCKIEAILARKGKAPVAELTAYDYPTARLVDEAGVDMILVGDSLGMVMLGYPDTTHVTLAHMLHHVEAVARAAKKAVVVADMPINTYNTPEQAVETAQALMAVGADAVKLEGGVAVEAQIRAITQAGIPVQGHIGLLPQKVKEDGGYRMHGKTDEEAAAIMRDMEAVVRAGAFSVVIECTKHSVAKAITDACPIITIGIGAGRSTCDGEVAVFHDLVGGFPWFTPSFARPRADIATEISRAVKEYISEVKNTI